jgi:hypothetical protein
LTLVGKTDHKLNSMRVLGRTRYLSAHQVFCVFLGRDASTTSDPSAKIILVEALGRTDSPLDDKPLLPVFSQQWNNVADFLDGEPGAPSLGEEMLLGRLIRSTISQAVPGVSGYCEPEPIITMLHCLPATPIFVRDHAMILAIAACCRTSTFHWGDAQPPVVLPPNDAFDFALDHYDALAELVVPTWIWLSMSVQAVGKEPSLSSPLTGMMPLSSRSSAARWHESQLADMIFSVSRDNSILSERERISAWLNQRPISDSLRRAVDHKIKNPDPNCGPYDPVPLTMFLAIILSEGNSTATLWRRFGHCRTQYRTLHLCQLIICFLLQVGNPPLYGEKDRSRTSHHLILYGHCQTPWLTLLLLDLQLCDPPLSTTTLRKPKDPLHTNLPIHPILYEIRPTSLRTHLIAIHLHCPILEPDSRNSRSTALLS